MNSQKMALKVLTVAVPAMLLLGACGNSATPEASAKPTASAGDLTGKTFVFSDVTVGTNQPPPPNGGDGISLTFTDNGISGTGGCNTMIGGADVANDKLNVKDGLATTEMACQPAKRMDQDTWFSDFLTSSPTLSVTGSTVTLTSDGTVLTLADQAAGQTAATLVGPTWKLDSIINDDAVSNLPQGVASTITFADDGTVAIDDGCNSLSGGYTVDNGVITFGNLSTTLKGCLGQEAQVADSVAEVLQDEVTYVIDGQRLTLTNGTNGLSYTTL